MAHTRTAVVVSAALLLVGTAANADSAPSVPSATTDTTASARSAMPVAHAPATEPVGSCGASAFLGTFSEPVVLFCDGVWARAGQAQTDAILLFQFRDGGWQIRQADGTSWPSNYPCHDEAALRADGAPEELINQTLLCEAPAP